MAYRAFRAPLVCAVCFSLVSGCSSLRSDGADQSLTADSRLRVATAAEASGNRDLAVSMYSAAARAAPADSAVQVQSAEGLVARRLKVDPRDADLLRVLGGIQILDGHEAEAIATLSDVLALKPGDSRALADQAVALDILGHHTEAQALYRRALVEVPADPSISNDLALSLLLSGRVEEARTILAPFRNAAGVPERIQNNLAILDAASGRPALAQAALGGRIGDADLAAMTRAITAGQPEFSAKP
jgi:Flp pilus assembly protein TadD